MVPLNECREIVERILEEYTRIPYSHGELTCDALFDRVHDRYALMTVGWDRGKRVHFNLIHIDLIDGKLWIQRDNTERGVAKELVQAGIPKSQIVLAFHDSNSRKLTDYAVA
jgi:hypothetical protein